MKTNWFTKNNLISFYKIYIIKKYKNSFLTKKQINHV